MALASVPAGSGMVLADFSHTIADVNAQQQQQRARFGAELEQLLGKLPAVVRAALDSLCSAGGESVSLDNLAEIYIQQGRFPEAIFCDETGQKQRHVIGSGKCDEADVLLFRDTFGGHPNVSADAYACYRCVRTSRMPSTSS